jgi:SAM-dependent methyltransferase
MHSEFYRHARTYEIAFSYRDLPRELAFITDAYAAATSRPLKSALELACGPAYHAMALARRGVPSVALDLSREMVELAVQRAKEQNLPVTGVVANMARFELPARVDLALNLLTSITYLTDTQDLKSHFAGVSACLNPGGVYVVETNHPRDFITHDHFQPSIWEMEEDGVRVKTTWVAEKPVLHPARGTYSVLARYEVNDHGSTSVLEDRAELRMLWPDELRLLAEAAGLTFHAWYGDHDLKRPMDDAPESWRMIAVFRKPG